MNKKIIIFVTAMVLVLAMATGATFAYLFADGDPITNTFVPTCIGKPTVAESKTDFTVVPGVSIPKDPNITYAPDENTDKNIGTAVLYATIALKGSTWSYANNKFTFTSGGNTLDFTINSTNWVYAGKAKSGEYIFAHKKVINGAEATKSPLYVISENKVNVSTGWTEAQIKSVFGATSKVQINVGAFVAQAHPTITTAVGTGVTAAKAKSIWNNLHGSDYDITT